MSAPRFICDEQLGRLAKWLRLQGFDTVFQCPVSDFELVTRAQQDGRIVLTRDRHLLARTIWPHVFLIQASSYDQQLEELRRTIRLPRGKAFSRCLDCNERIEPIPKQRIQSKVPEAVYQSYQEFYTCPKCKKVFWRGSHVSASLERLRRQRRP